MVQDDASAAELAAHQFVPEVTLPAEGHKPTDAADHKLGEMRRQIALKRLAVIAPLTIAGLFVVPHVVGPAVALAALHHVPLAVGAMHAATEAGAVAGHAAAEMGAVVGAAHTSAEAGAAVSGVLSSTAGPIAAPIAGAVVGAETFGANLAHLAAPVAHAATETVVKAASSAGTAVAGGAGMHPDGGSILRAPNILRSGPR